MTNNDIVKINKDKIKCSNENKRTRSTFLTLALIRNDISDLVYLQGLFVKSNKDIKYEISSVSGQFTGRMIYIMRLALSHYYEFLFFIDKRKKEIDNDLEFQVVLKSLNKKNKEVWHNFYCLASELKTIGEISKVKPNIKYKVAALAESIRGNLTFHYYHSSFYLYKGFIQAFYLDKQEEKNKHPLVTESENVSKDRSYYIDLSIERYLENESMIDENLFKFEKNIINTIAEVNMILNRILNIYHKKIKI